MATIIQGHRWYLAGIYAAILLNMTDQPIDLCKELCFQPSGCFMFLSLVSIAHDGIQLINEDNTRGAQSGSLEQHADNFLRLTSILGDQCRCRAVEKGAILQGTHGLGEHGLARTRRSEQQHPLPWLPDSCKELWHHQRKYNRFMEKAFRAI